ncbi:hypothetical protein AgCh_038780 [Apium graveolens]
MNTSNIMKQHQRGVAPNKRKDREYQKPPKFIKPSQHERATTKIVGNKQESSASNNQLLAGYMAYEFLSKGTLLGQQLANSKRLVDPNKVKMYKKYVEITGLFKRDGGVQIPDVVNPTQINPFSQP